MQPCYLKTNYDSVHFSRNPQLQEKLTGQGQEQIQKEATASPELMLQRQQFFKTSVTLYINKKKTAVVDILSLVRHLVTLSADDEDRQADG